MAELLVEFVFGAGMRLLDQCGEAKQCEEEVVRIAVRTQNVLGTLKVGQLFLVCVLFFLHVVPSTVYSTCSYQPR